MNMFFEVYDRNAEQTLQVNVTDVRSYTEQDQVDKQGNTHYLIVYALKENRYIEEEFTDTTERSSKLEKLAQFAV